MNDSPETYKIERADELQSLKSSAIINQKWTLVFGDLEMRPEMVEPINDSDLNNLKNSILSRWNRKTHYLNDSPLSGDITDSPACMMRAHEILGLIKRIEILETRLQDSDEDQRRLEHLDAMTAENMERFRFKSECEYCGFQSMEITPDIGQICPMNSCDGPMTSILRETKS